MRKFYCISSRRESLKVFDKPEHFNLENGCSECGTNSKRLKLIINKIPKNDFDSTIQHDFLISKNVISTMSENGIKVNHLKEVLLNKDMSFTGFYHLNGEYELPRFLFDSKGVITESQCKSCGQDGFYDTLKEDIEYHYQKNNLFKIADILTTWEHFGPSIKNPTGNRVFRLARPKIIVSEKVKSILEHIKYSKLNFEQIRID